MASITNSPADRVPETGWRWAPAWVLAFVALWPAPGYAEAVLVVGALIAMYMLIRARFRGGTRLLSGQAWALTTLMFAAYWVPRLVSTFDTFDPLRSLLDAATDLRHLPFLWLVAAAVANAENRRKTFAGLGIIVLVWVADALLQAMTGNSPIFNMIDHAKHAIDGRGMCPAEASLVVDRLSGFLGPCNLKLGQVVASLSPFLLYEAARRFRATGWLVAAAGVGMVIVLAGSRASWITYGLVLLLSGWRLLGWKRLLGVFAFGAVALALLTVSVPQVRERIERTTLVLAGDHRDVDSALSGRGRIWSAATCMIKEHPFNGVGVRRFRLAFPSCDPLPGQRAEWGEGPALHAHQIVLEILSETGFLGLILWLAGAAQAWRAWRYADPEARAHARPAMYALVVTVFPFNTHLAFYSTFWGGLTLMLFALYAGSLYATDRDRSAAKAA
ncbi:O-antigen ligase family protein [Lysobacter sp. TY2-98]|uniref:O-antigen ligase family protein n=1 Tax=Lysobacter sp. TY2-98 TaxID=2290922 RepID=UPI001F0762D3|nr:O-antigen ligase family protein [Lysobacter sp. TY2-98]